MPGTACSAQLRERAGSLGSCPGSLTVVKFERLPLPRGPSSLGSPTPSTVVTPRSTSARTRWAFPVPTGSASQEALQPSSPWLTPSRLLVRTMAQPASGRQAPTSVVGRQVGSGGAGRQGGSWPGAASWRGGPRAMPALGLVPQPGLCTAGQCVSNSGSKAPGRAGLHPEGRFHKSCWAEGGPPHRPQAPRPPGQT